MFQLSDRVAIVGGVLQEYGVRLDGLTGLIASSRHDAPAGTFAVYVLWEDSPYHDRADELPKWVNVPPKFLFKLDDDETADTPSPQPESSGGLRLVD